MAEVNDDGTPNEPTVNPLFTVDDSTKNFFEEYVGPGKKYPNVGELAKAYANADRHIAELSRDTGKFKTEAEQLRELLMENIVNKNEPPKNDGNQPNTPPNDADPSKEPRSNESPPKEDGKNVDIKALIKEAMDERTQEEKLRDNARTTEEATVKRFGSKEDAQKAIEAKAEELGVSPQWIANLAFESPKAYYATMGFKPDELPKSNNTPNPRSDVNPQALGQTNTQPAPNTYRYFQELRRTSPSKWRSQEIQQAILKAAQENPDFYK